MALDKKKIEEKIYPLVYEISNLNLFHTFSSCQGHFEDNEQELQDKNKADVRFELLDGTSIATAEHFITYLMTEFNNKYSFTPITLFGYKLYSPDDDYEVDHIFVIELKPFDRFDNSKKKRREIDIAIINASDIVTKYKELLINNTL